jgi:hypothetical protein
MHINDIKINADTTAVGSKIRDVLFERFIRIWKFIPTAMGTQSFIVPSF